MVPADSDKVPRAPPYSGYPKESISFRLQDYHLILFSFPANSTMIQFCNSVNKVLQPQSKDWFGLFPFRSPLLRKSIFLSFPPGTKMFQFPGLLSLQLCIHYRILAHYHKCVATFGNPRIKAYLQLPEAYRSQSRPSSASNAKQSTIRPYQFNHQNI